MWASSSYEGVDKGNVTERSRTNVDTDDEEAGRRNIREKKTLMDAAVDASLPEMHRRQLWSRSLPFLVSFYDGVSQRTGKDLAASLIARC